MRLAELELPATPEFVSLARLVVSSIADDRYEITDTQLDDLKLALSEACIVAMATQDSSSQGKVTIACEGTNDSLAVVVDGKGKHFERATSGPALADGLLTEAQQSQASRLGLPLIDTLVDQIAIEEVPTGTRLRMTIFCERAEEL